jgi:hypothetical protein
MVLMRDLRNFSFFSQGDVSPTHSELFRFVSGSQAKHQVSSSIIISLKKNFACIGHHNNVLARCDLSSLCTGVKECRTKRALSFLFPKSSFRMQTTTVLGIFKDACCHSQCNSMVILDQIRNGSNVYLSSSR